MTIFEDNKEEKEEQEQKQKQDQEQEQDAPNSTILVDDTPVNNLQSRHGPDLMEEPYLEQI